MFRLVSRLAHQLAGVYSGNVDGLKLVVFVARFPPFELNILALDQVPVYFDVRLDGAVVNEQVVRVFGVIDGDETVEIAFVADNPGKWLLHCHMLEHAAAGMQTWFEVI